MNVKHPSSFTADFLIKRIELIITVGLVPRNTRMAYCETARLHLAPEPRRSSDSGSRTITQLFSSALKGSRESIRTLFSN